MIFNRDLCETLRKAGLLLAIFLSLCVPRFAYSIQTDTILETARKLIGGENLVGASTLLESYIKEAPPSAEAHFLLGYVLFRQKLAKESLAQFTAGAQIKSPSVTELKIIAADYILLGDFNDADKWLTNVVNSSPHDPDAWYLLGRTKYNENHFDEAIESFNHTLSLRPRDVKAENNLGISYEGLNRVEEAQSAFQTAISWQENSSIQDAQPFLNLGSLLLRDGQAAGAITWLSKAVQAAPDNAKAREQLSQAYITENNLLQAQHELEIAVKLAPNASALHYKLGQLYHRLGKTTDSQREFDLCARLLSTNSSIDIPNPPSTQ